MNNCRLAAARGDPKSGVSEVQVSGALSGPKSTCRDCVWTASPSPVQARDTAATSVQTRSHTAAAAAVAPGTVRVIPREQTRRTRERSRPAPTVSRGHPFNQPPARPSRRSGALGRSRTTANRHAAVQRDGFKFSTRVEVCPRALGRGARRAVRRRATGVFAHDARDRASTRGTRAKRVAIRSGVTCLRTHASC